jgi:hypothetical protein
MGFPRRVEETKVNIDCVKEKLGKNLLLKSKFCQLSNSVYDYGVLKSI